MSVQKFDVKSRKIFLLSLTRTQNLKTVENVCVHRSQSCLW
ncbi:hypothetical protein Nmel_000555 [Mimus melanotis]